MTTEKVRISGGPADGQETAAGSRFVWIELMVLKRTTRTDGAGLYELRDGEYSFIGGHRSVCEECGAVYGRAEGGAEDRGCPVCGAVRAA